MRKYWSLLPIGGVLAATLCLATSVRADDTKEAKEPVKAEAKSDAKEASEFIEFDKAKLGTVRFPHKKHADVAGSCDACHGGKEPLFAQKKSGAMKMADMYAGKGCGHCHDGKTKQGDKVIFPAKGGCMKCHKKEVKAK